MSGMASAADFTSSVGATIGAEGGGKSGGVPGTGPSLNPVAGTIGQDYYTSKIIYPEGVVINPDDGTPKITKLSSPRPEGEKGSTR